MANEDPAELVWIEHPDLPPADPGRVTRRSFKGALEAKGWKIIPDDEHAKNVADAERKALKAEVDAVRKAAPAKAGS